MKYLILFFSCVLCTKSSFATVNCYNLNNEETVFTQISLRTVSTKDPSYQIDEIVVLKGPDKRWDLKNAKRAVLADRLNCVEQSQLSLFSCERRGPGGASREVGATLSRSESMQTNSTTNEIGTHTTFTFALGRVGAPPVKHYFNNCNLESRSQYLFLLKQDAVRSVYPNEDLGLPVDFWD